MARMFESEAQLVVDGVANPVYARIGAYGEGGSVKGWFGSLGSDDSALGWEAFNARTVTLRMPDGEEGSVLIEEEGSAETGIGFKGSGPPPF